MRKLPPWGQLRSRFVEDVVEQVKAGGEAPMWLIRACLNDPALMREVFPVLEVNDVAL